MRKREQGIGLGGLLSVLFIVVILGIFGMKLIPSYMEFHTIKNTVKAIAGDKSRTATVGEVRKAFNARASIDDITSVKAEDLEITKDGGEIVIGFAYRKEIPLVSNIGLFVDFAGNSKGQ